MFNLHRVLGSAIPDMTSGLDLTRGLHGLLPDAPGLYDGRRDDILHDRLPH